MSGTAASENPFLGILKKWATDPRVLIGGMVAVGLGAFVGGVVGDHLAPHWMWSKVQTLGSTVLGAGVFAFITKSVALGGVFLDAVRVAVREALTKKSETDWYYEQSKWLYTIEMKDGAPFVTCQWTARIRAPTETTGIEWTARYKASAATKTNFSKFVVDGEVVPDAPKDGGPSVWRKMLTGKLTYEIERIHTATIDMASDPLVHVAFSRPVKEVDVTVIPNGVRVELRPISEALFKNELAYVTSTDGRPFFSYRAENQQRLMGFVLLVLPDAPGLKVANASAEN